ncbi:MAG: histidine phosphatase family protein [Gammaproteobacteria bacterium]|nr:histidine phosphatase family protein [Gammaproteobacteria bacterium]
MKILYLLRHAKSSWSNPGLDDQQRPLSKRGNRDAPIMGERFGAREEFLSLILSSPALRARNTAELFAEACGFPVGKIVEQPELYFSGIDTIEKIIAHLDDQYRSLMLVFHNPDINAFVNSINSAPYINNVPTSGLVKLVSDIDHWHDWSSSNAQFEYFDYPKKLSG